jgi:hypothetical protein
MKTKSSASRMAPLQYLEIEPITDPAEVAALERKLRSSRSEAAQLATRNGRKISRKSVSEIIDLAERLSAKDQLRLLSALAAQLAAGKRRKLVERIV